MPKFSIQAHLFSAQHVGFFLEALTQANEDELRRNPRFPRVYSSGVRYQREPDGVNRWLGCVEAYALKVCDCEDLAAWRVAEARQRDGLRRARCDVKFIREGLWHVRVLLPNGVVEDPSKILGMGQPER